MRFTYLILPIVLTIGCQSAPVYRDAMAEQCMSVDPKHFRYLTDEELRQCGAWLNSPERPSFGQSRRTVPSTIFCVDLGGGLISCDNGGDSEQTIFIN
jgi:hypothetical protein